jgi:hypothetical protein
MLQRLRSLRAPLSVAAVALGLAAAPTAAAGDGDCGLILPAADRLETVFNLVPPSGAPSYLAGQIRNALSPLQGLRRTPVTRGSP